MHCNEDKQHCIVLSCGKESLNRSYSHALGGGHAAAVADVVADGLVASVSEAVAQQNLLALVAAMPIKNLQIVRACLCVLLSLWQQAKPATFDIGLYAII